MVESLLAQHGFETCFPDLDPDAAERCMAAGVIVALDGSNLANLIFSAPGTSVLVLSPVGFANPPYTLSLAQHCGTRLVMMDVTLDQGGLEAEVDVETFRAALDCVLSG
jgi:capsular polysaccharide biosynthesis protein